MRHLHAKQKRRPLRLLGTLPVLGLVLLCAFVAGESIGPLDWLVPGFVGTAEADPSKGTQDTPTEAKKPRNEVIVYVTSWCPACRMTTDYLNKKDIPYTVKDIEKNEKFMKEMLQKVGAYRGVPVLDINGRILLGFNPQALDQLAK